MRLAVISVTTKGAALGERLKGSLKGDIVLYEKEGRGVSNRAITYNSLKTLTQDIFLNFDGLIFIMAAGIAVRMIAPYVNDKRSDPAVVVVDDGGVHAISLLSGHLGGANELTKSIASTLGAAPVITTSTDVAQKVAPDVLSRQWDLEIEPFHSLKAVNAALANGEKVSFYLDAMLSNRREFTEKAKELELTFDDMDKCLHNKTWQQDSAAVFITDKVIEVNLPFVALRPRSLVVGVGCRRGVSKELVLEAISLACQRIGRSMMSIKKLVSIDIKQDETGLLSAGRELKADFKFFSKAELAKCIIDNKLSVSDFVLNQIGVGNVCEAAAILAAPNKELVLRKTKFKEVTIAIAEVRQPL